MKNEEKLLLLAQDVSIAEDNDDVNPVFMQIKMRVCTNEGNRNGEGVSASFISSIVNNSEIYDGIPLYCDVKNLLAKNYRNLGHMYSHGKFHSTQIGALIDFYSETNDDGVTSLYATARVPRRESEITACLNELYAENSLSFSFEVKFNPEYSFVKNGVKFIDAHPDNCLCGVAVVSVPAYENAVALDLVAEQHTDVPEGIVTACDEQNDRGEKEPMNETNKNMNAETQEVIAEEVIQSNENTVDEASTIVAEGEGASEGAGEGASESGGEGASEGGSGASEGGAGASEGGGDSGGGSNDVTEDALTNDPDDEKKANAEVQDANAEVLEISTDTHESVENYGGKPVHVIEYHERIIETMEEAGTVIAELETKIAELEQIKVQYDEIIAEREAKALAEKQAKARAFAEKQGLNAEDTAVAEAIKNLDYTKIAELSMAEEQEEAQTEPVVQTITLASFVEMDVSDDKYGGLLSRKK